MKGGERPGEPFQVEPVVPQAACFQACLALDAKPGRGFSTPLQAT